MKRAHRMPFGAEYLGDGSTRFRLWAPSAHGGAMDLLLQWQDGEKTHAMTAQGGGWFEAVMPAPPGTRYRFRLQDGLTVPDPGSRHNPEDVHGPSEVVDPRAFEWSDDAWTGRPWDEAVIYELHVGTFTPEGTFEAMATRLDHLHELGVTAIELMPLAEFPGLRNWGYDGVLPFAPDSVYGRPEDLKRAIDAAHRRGLMVLVDVVYNHFGPEGNYLWHYAAPFFTRRHHTPWGPALNFDGDAARTVRDFFIHNALYWLEEYHVDGLRLDAIHAILDDSPQPMLCELAEAVRAGPGRERHVHLVLENDANRAFLLKRNAGNRPVWYDAQWNDDLHHGLHVLLTGETSGYYSDYAQDTTRHVARSLAEGFAYQGEPSGFRGTARRGEPSTHLPPTAFVGFLQNHDQIGNRAHGRRLVTLAQEEPLAAAVAALLWSPNVPLIFMGEEFGALTPFLFFCDFEGNLARAVTEGRRREFAAFVNEVQHGPELPDPNTEETFAHSKIDWTCMRKPRHARWLALYRKALKVRRDHIVPRLRGIGGNAGSYRVLGEGVLAVQWAAAHNETFRLFLNLTPHDMPGRIAAPGKVIGCHPPAARTRVAAGALPRYTAACCIDATVLT